DTPHVAHSIRWGGDPEDLTLVFSGEVPLEELFATFDEVRAAPGYTNALRMIHDHRATDWSNVTGDDIRRRAQRLAAYARPDEHHRVAIVVDRTVAYGLMRMREALAEGTLNSSDRVFYDLEAARAWLGDEPA